jgi:hypothetical protein
MLMLAVYFGVYYAMPHRAVSKQPTAEGGQ